MKISIPIAATLMIAALAPRPEVASPKRALAPSNVIMGRLTVLYEDGNEVSASCFPVDKTEKTLFLITANHSVTDPRERKIKSLSVELYKLDVLVFETDQVKIVLQNEPLDVACLGMTLEDVNIPTLRLSNNSPRSGRNVFSFGSQVGWVPTFTHGYVCRPAPDIKAWKHAWITSANAIDGASGGPVIDAETGEVIGVTAAVASYYPGPFRCPVPHVQVFVDASKVQIWLSKELKK
jgi:S1-C subfamily serine protease